MANEDRKENALEHLSEILARVLRLGLDDLPPDARGVVEAAVIQQGCRVRFTVLLAPLVVVCHLVKHGVQPTEIFRVETEIETEPLRLH